MKLSLITDSWKAKNKTFYVVRFAVSDESGNIVRKGDPVIWLTEEQFDLIKIQF